MSSVGQREIHTQARVIAHLCDALDYAYLGHWKHREANSNVDPVKPGWQAGTSSVNRVLPIARGELPRLWRAFGEP